MWLNLESDLVPNTHLWSLDRAPILRLSSSAVNKMQLPSKVFQLYRETTDQKDLTQMLQSGIMLHRIHQECNSHRCRRSVDLA
jgi:hypothetical protein